ncbi:urease accessory protein UreD [Litoreibacter roseus]|uniref:Urease accessory protein UreD n=1 Tax=Litoreibacter roseus TaxID=2601869 RepID=A0A6N6JCF6_9RHOB|nr:urease accessory protein UreD [Litoreibacter roseus]GFE64011.1 urease accessory protein UreD [Litoreibacter roseus]
MFDNPVRSDLQRVRGRATVGLSSKGLKTLHQSGSAKALLPRVQGTPEVVFLNTAGGVTGGDDLSYALALAPDTEALATTQTAERIYRSTGDTGSVTVKLEVGARSVLSWVPQETIVFDGAALTRRTEVDLAPFAAFLMSEMIVLGRQAMGETVRFSNVRDARVIRRDGQVIYRDTQRIHDDVLADGDNPALLDGARALGLIGFFAEAAPLHTDALRAILAHHPVRSGVSGWDGRVMIRLLAEDAFQLRRAVVACVEMLRGAPMPRVWQM